MKAGLETSSFRDRDGFIFYKDGHVYRAILPSYRNTWEQLSTSAFFNALLNDNKLVGFAPAEPQPGFPEAYSILKVQKVPFISYPSEWTFTQLKKAALLTLSIQKRALAEGFTLKDASAYNVQFMGPKPVFIDTLSFELYREGEPWQAYRQFCQHFLGPLLLWHYGIGEARSWFINYIDGIPLALSSKLLPLRSRFNLLAYTHIHLHAKFEAKHGEKAVAPGKTLSISKSRSLSLLDHLEQGIRGLHIKTSGTNWTDYYDSFSYSKEGYAAKKDFLEKHLSALKGNLCTDLGANTGEFSQMASQHFNYVVACDNDIEVVSAIQSKKTGNLLALHNDLVNPTPAFGWNGRERQSFIDRVKASDLVLALALIHHLCIGNNVPLEQLAEFFARISRHLVIEFVPKTDVQVKKLLVTKKDIFNDYTLERFKSTFGNYFSVLDQQPIPGSERVLFLLKKTTDP